MATAKCHRSNSIPESEEGELPDHEVVDSGDISTMDQEPTDALSALKNISEILKGGFKGMDAQMTSLRKSVKSVNTNVVTLSSNMESGFNELRDVGDSESGSESDTGHPAGGQAQPARPRPARALRLVQRAAW